MLFLWHTHTHTHICITIRVQIIREKMQDTHTCTHPRVQILISHKKKVILKMKNAAFGSLTSTLTSKTQKTSKTHLSWLQICLTGAVVTVQLHQLREGNGPEMRACGINYGRAMSFIWSILSRTMTQQSQKEKKTGGSFLAWVWKSVLCKANLMKPSLLYIKGTYPWASHRFGLADRI